MNYFGLAISLSQNVNVKTMMHMDFVDQNIRVI